MSKTITLSAVVSDSDLTFLNKNNYINRTLKALKYSASQFKTDKVQLITQSLPKSKQMCLYFYSRFILKEYYKYINTDFVLHIQHDGFIIHPELWEDEFLNYDNIGAISCCGTMGNGGFCIISRRMLEATAKSPFIDYYPEDVFRCIAHRTYFESQGLTYAPMEIAARFSQEEKTSYNPNCDYNNWQNTKSFGFHGSHHKSAISLLDNIKL